MIEQVKSVVIENVYPELDCGRYAVKREVGEVFEVWADIYKEGHDVIAARLKYRKASEPRWHETPMGFFDNDRWTGSFELAQNTRYLYTVEAFKDEFESWRQELEKKVAAGQDVQSELLEGEGLIRATAARAPRAGRL